MTYYENIITDALSNLELQDFKNSKYIYWGDRLTDKILNSHKKHYANISNDERVLFVLNNINSIMMMSFKVGIVVTDKNLYYRALKDSFLAGLIPKYYSGCIPLNSISEIRIGRHDIGFGTSYNGHQIIVNGKIIGIVRMGEGYTFDDATIDTLSYIFKCISDGYHPESNEEVTEQFLYTENEENKCISDGYHPESDEEATEQFLDTESKENKCISDRYHPESDEEATEQFLDTESKEKLAVVNEPQPKKTILGILSILLYALFLFVIFIVVISLFSVRSSQADSYGSSNENNSTGETPEYVEAPKVNKKRDNRLIEILSPDGKYTVRVIELDNTYPSGEGYEHEKALVIRDVRNNREIEIARHRDAPSPVDCLCGFENIEWSTDSRHVYFSCPVYASGSTVNKINIITGKIKHIASGDYFGYIRYGKYKGCVLVAVPTFENGYRDYYGSIINDNRQEITRIPDIYSYNKSELISIIQNM